MIAYFEHIFAHRVVQFVFQGLVFKVKLYLVTVIIAILVL